MREEERLIEALALIYNADSGEPPFMAVATVCDEELDRSGALLGRVRAKARALRERAK